MTDKGKLKPLAELGKVILFCVLCAAILATSSAVAKNWYPFVSVGIATTATILLTGIVTAFDVQRLNDIGVIPNSKTMVRISIGFLIGLLLVLVQFLTVLVGGKTSLSFNSGVGLSTALFSTLLYFLVALREEFAFRGYPIRKLNYCMGPVVAQAVVAGIFIIEHYIGGMNWWQSILGPGVGALLFGAAALRSKGIALPFGLHFAWNFGQWAMGFKDQNGLLKFTIEPGFEAHTEFVGWAGYLLAMTLGVIVVYGWTRKRQ